MVTKLNLIITLERLANRSEIRGNYDLPLDKCHSRHELFYLFVEKLGYKIKKVVRSCI